MFDDRYGGEGSEQASTERYVRLRGSGALAEARRFDLRIRQAEWTRAEVLWRTDNQAATPASRELYRFDREMRRAAVIVRSREFRRMPAPLPLRDGRLEIRSAQVGSFELTFDAVGIVAMVLLSDPMQLALTTRALVGDALRVSGWLHGLSHDKAPNAVIELPGGGRVSARHRLEIKGFRPDGSIDSIVAE